MILRQKQCHFRIRDTKEPPRHCERSEAIQSQAADAALDRHGGKRRLAMTALIRGKLQRLAGIRYELKKERLA